MGEDQEQQQFKHVCKFCCKSFPCGRSLGGHMRSHMITITETTTADDHHHRKHLPKKRLPSLNNSTDQTNGSGYYGLRENPKKSKRIADSSGDNMNTSQQLQGKAFMSSNNSTSLDDQGSGTSAANDQKLVVTDSQSDNETNGTPNRKRRSKRRTRYMAAAATTVNSCSVSVANSNHNNSTNQNNGSSSVSEIEQAQEEVAMCLMMLSRDHHHHHGGCGRGVLKDNSIAESSDNNSVMNKDTETEIDQAQAQLGSCTKKNSSATKKKIRKAFDPELGSDSLKRSTTTDASGVEFCKESEKRSKFECATCNKVFYSYQALGGHRASHKKIRGCFASKIGSTENSFEAEDYSPDPTAEDSKLIINSITNENSSADHHFFVLDHSDDHHRAETSSRLPKNKRHECPICLRVFSSGQALGGHKRSHLVGGSPTVAAGNNSPTIVTEDHPIPEIRNLLDLNLPAASDDHQQSSNNAHLGLQQWWISTRHKHEALVGLISN